VLIFILGYMGSGKTTFGRVIAGQLSYRFLDLDELIENETGKRIPDLFSELKEDGFRRIEKDVLLQHLDDQDTVIATGGGTPCFSNNMELMNQRGITVFLDIEPETIYARISGEAHLRPILKNISRENRFSFIINHLEERKFYYNQAKIILKKDDPEEFRKMLSNYSET